MANLSPETTAIIEALDKQGDLVRNSDSNSIKSVKVELGKFHNVFSEMKNSLGGLSKKSSASLAIAEQDAKLRALSDKEKEEYLRKEAEMEQRKQELENQRLIKEEKKQNEDQRERSSWMKGIKGFFGGITGFFKKWGLILAGSAFAYEFIAGIIEEKFKIDLPTVAEGVNKLSTFLQETDWAGATESIKYIALLAGSIAAISFAAGPLLLAMGTATTAARIVGNIANKTAGISTTGPTVSTGSGGQKPGATPRNFTIDKDGNPVSNKTGKILQGSAKETALRVAREDAGKARPSRFKIPGKRIPGVAGAVITGGMVALNLMNDDSLDSGATEEDLLAAISTRDTTLKDLAVDTIASAGAGAAVGGGLGLLTGGPGVVPGAIAGAISGAAWGFATSALLGVKRTIEDSSFFGEGVDELPNSLERALREEKAVFEAGMEGQVEAVEKVTKAASDFLNKNQSKLEETQNEIVAIERQLENTELTGKARQTLESQLKALNTDAEFMEKRNEISLQVLQRRSQQLMQLNSQTSLPTGTNAESLGQIIEMIAQGGLGAPQQYFFNKGGDTNNFQNTSMNKSSAVSYRQNMSGFGGRGSNSSESFPGMFA